MDQSLFVSEMPCKMNGRSHLLLPLTNAFHTGTSQEMKEMLNSSKKTWLVEFAKVLGMILSFGKNFFCTSKQIKTAQYYEIKKKNSKKKYKSATRIYV